MSVLATLDGESCEFRKIFWFSSTLDDSGSRVEVLGFQVR